MLTANSVEDIASSLLSSPRLAVLAFTPPAREDTVGYVALTAYAAHTHAAKVCSSVPLPAEVAMLVSERCGGDLRKSLCAAQLAVRVASSKCCITVSKKRNRY